MSCNCYKSINKPYTYVKSNRKGFITITDNCGYFMTQAQPIEFINKNRDIYKPIDQKEFDDVWDRYMALTTDIDSEANSDAMQSGCQIENRVIAARQII